MNSSPARFYEFGPFRLDTSAPLLWREGQPVALTPKALETLIVLVQRAGRLTSREDLIQAVWPDTVVEENNLSVNISMLRKVLGDTSDADKYIETVPRRGYRFVAQVRAGEGNSGAWVLEKRLRASIIKNEPVDGGITSTPVNLHLATGVEQSCEPEALVTTHPLDLEDVRMEGSLSKQRASAHVGRLPQHRHWVVPGAAALIIAATVVAYVYLNRGVDVKSDQGPISSLAVMPFVNTSADPNTEYLSDGITESLINNLSLLPNLKIKSRSSVFHYKGQENDAHAIGRELGVRAVLTGRVVRRGDNLSISVELVDARDNSHLWGQQYEGKLSDVLSVQREITQQITRKLRFPLTGAEQKLVNKQYTESTEAYQLYMRGRYFWNKRTVDGVKKGIEFFNQATARDPNFALAYSGLADSYNVLSQFRELSPEEAMPKAKAAALKALELDDSLAEAHASLAMIKKVYHWDWAGAEMELNRAIELNPNYANAYHWHALFLSAMGEHEEALTEIRRAKELDPVSLIISTNEGWILFCARRYDLAIEQFRQTMEMDPNFANAHYKLAMAYEMKGLHDEAVKEYLKDDLLSGRAQEEVTLLRAAFSAAGWDGFCRTELRLLRKRSQREYVSPEDFVLISLQLGETERAFEWLQKAYEERAGLLTFLKVDPRFDNLRSDTRFGDLLRRVKLAP